MILYSLLLLTLLYTNAFLSENDSSKSTTRSPLQTKVNRKGAETDKTFLSEKIKSVFTGRNSAGSSSPKKGTGKTLKRLEAFNENLQFNRSENVEKNFTVLDLIKGLETVKIINKEKLSSVTNQKSFLQNQLNLSIQASPTRDPCGGNILL